MARSVTIYQVKHILPADVVLRKHFITKKSANEYILAIIKRFPKSDFEIEKLRVSLDKAGIVEILNQLVK